MTESAHNIAVENMRDLWNALRLIRDEIERHAAIPEETPEPDPGKDAQILVEAINGIVQRYEERISNLEGDIKGAYNQLHQTKLAAERTASHLKLTLMTAKSTLRRWRSRTFVS